ncbi:class I SAM-dependent methyltransferase [Serratia odorifera]|uniref:class I SAM-dependent methyltransferase n=1 Tax=Serratia odorifera TaxID=618 RepID=UPI003531BF58
MEIANSQSQFDSLAIFYEQMFEWPFRKQIETPSVIEQLGGVSSLNILDFGCGTGHYARLLKSSGAHHVVGFDVAGGMLEYAKKREMEKPLGIEYISKITPEMAHTFDLVLAVYVLPYATNYDFLKEMVATMARMLKPGGRLLTLPLNPEYKVDQEYYLPYGFQLSGTQPQQDGSTVQLSFPQQSGAPICANYWSRGAIDSALAHNGFTVTCWRNPEAACAADEIPEHLHAYLAHPHTVLVDCKLG